MANGFCCVSYEVSGARSHLSVIQLQTHECRVRQSVAVVSGEPLRRCFDRRRRGVARSPGILCRFGGTHKTYPTDYHATQYQAGMGMRKRDQDSELPHDTLKDALAEIVFRSAISVKAQADELGEAISTVYRWADVNQPDCYPPLTKIVPHTRATGNVALIRFLAAQVNCVLVPLRDLQQVMVEPRQLSLFQAGLLAIVKEVGEMVAALEQSMTDGKLSEREARRCRKECDDALDRLVLLREQLR